MRKTKNSAEYILDDDERRLVFDLTITYMRRDAALTFADALHAAIDAVTDIGNQALHIEEAGIGSLSHHVRWSEAAEGWVVRRTLRG